VLLATGAGHFRVAWQAQVPRARGDESLRTTLALGDADGDGRPDLVRGSERAVGGGDLPITLLAGRGDGTFGPPRVIDAAVRGTLALTIADLDRDGLPDLVDTRASSVRVLLGRGGGRFEPVGTFLGRRHDAGPLAVDLDGDGWLDLVGGAAVLMNRGVR
jgi:hypothetical protein